MPEYSRIVVGVAGRLGSGKSEVAHSLEQGFGFQYLRYSMILADWLGTDPRDKSRLQEFGWDVMAGEGQYELNRRLIDRIHPTKDVAVDGLRHPIDYESLREKFGMQFSLIFVDTIPAIRFARLQNRYSTYGEFLAADAHPVESSIDSLQPLAFITIEGTMSSQRMTSELRSLVSVLRQRATV